MATITDEKKDPYKTKRKKALYLEALQRALGIKTTAINNLKAKGVTLDPKTVTSWEEKDSKFAREVKACDDLAGDFAESALYKKIQEGDTTAIIFFLKTKMKKRGYTERMEVTGAGGKDLISQKTDEELNKMIEELQRKLE